VTAAKPLYTTNGIELFEKPGGRVYGYRGSQWVGYTFPVAAVFPGESDSQWVARRDGEEAVNVASRHAGIAHVVDRCPDCVCDSYACEHDDTGDSCLDCGYCLHGCSAGECETP
jgi:hypothetical protein